MDRRRFLVFTGALAGTALYAQVRGDLAAGGAAAPGYPFRLGVASGDPDPQRRVAVDAPRPEPLVEGGGMPAKDIGVRWQVASDSSFRRVVKSGKVAAMPELGHSVHVDVHGLRPGREYYYRFLTSADESPVGPHQDRARLARPRARPHVRVRLLPEVGRRVLHRRTARMADEDIELVVHLGDYIYEYGVGSGGVRNANVPPRSRPECFTLERYRLQHSLYKTDPDLQEAHRLFPWMVTWDDHEVDNDYSGIYPEFENTSPEFLARRAAAYQAYFENMPVPLSAGPKKGGVQLYRRLEYGDIARVQPARHAPVPHRQPLRRRRAAALRRGLRPGGDHDRQRAGEVAARRASSTRARAGT